MALDQTQNFVEVNVAGTHTDTATTIQLGTGEASELPDPTNGEYNLVWFDSRNYSKPSSDPEVEIVRVTGVDTANDTITVTRGQENTTAVAHDTGDAEYLMILGTTAKMIQDINDVTNLSGAAGTSGQFLTTDGSSLSFADVSAGGKFEQALSNGEVLVDDGNLYTSVQTAENNATDWMFIGPGTFNENVSVDTASLTIIGSGTNTLIDGGNSNALDINSNDVDIKSLAVQTTSGSTGRPINVDADDTVIEDIVVNSSGTVGIEINTGNDNIVRSCRVEAADSGSIRAEGNNTLVTDNILNSTADGVIGGGTNTVIVNNKSVAPLEAGFICSNNIIIGSSGRGISGNGGAIIEGNYIINSANEGIVPNTGNSVVNNNYISGSGSDGINTFSGSDVIISDNRIVDSSGDGINVGGTDVIIANNRISGSTNSDLNTSNATNPTTDANVTGAAN